MLPTTQENIKDYGLIACVITILTLWLRPFVSIWQAIKEMAITFSCSMCAGLILVGFDIPQPVRFGIAGIVGLLAVRIYGILDTFLAQIQKDPLGFCHELHKHHHKKGGEDGQI